MTHFVRGNQDLIKAMNRNLLLNIIRREGMISRKQVTELSGLSVGAVSGIVTELLLNNWILEIGEGDYTGGRRQTLIKLNPKAGYAIGLKLMEDRLVIAMSNFEAEIIFHLEETIQFGLNPNNFANSLAMTIKSFIKKSKIEAERLFGVGIGLAGVVQSVTGIVHYSPFFGWRNVPLAQLIQQELQIPVYIENDVNTLTLTEQLFGLGKHYQNFIVVTVGRGIGMGIVINGQIYRGNRGGAGELGHTFMSFDEGLEFISLEDLASDPATLSQSNETPARFSKMNELIQAADAGDEHARKILAKSGTILGVGIANTINILNPELVIISGEGTLAGDYRLEAMQEALRHYSFNGLMDDVKVLIEPTGDKAWARGAASLVISKVFESPMLEASIDS